MKHYLKGRKIRTVVQDEKSEFSKVKNEVPQRSVLVSIKFLVYVNYITEGLNSYISLVANDAELQQQQQQKNK